MATGSARGNGHGCGTIEEKLIAVCKADRILHRESMFLCENEIDVFARLPATDQLLLVDRICEARRGNQNQRDCNNAFDATGEEH